MRLSRLACLALAATLALPAFAADHDSVIKAQREAEGTPFQIDDDGDFQIVVNLGNGRTQLVWVRSVVEETNHQRVREIWSPGYQSQVSNFPASVANQLLEDGHSRKLGGWVKQGNTAMFVVKIPADANANVLDESIDLAATTADEVEQDLTGKDDL